MWVDEATYRDAGWAYVHGNTTPNPEHPPFAKLVIGAWQVAAGRGIDSLRVLAALVALATATAMWLWARDIVGPRAALVPAALWLGLDHAFADRARLDSLMSLDAVMVLLVVGGYAAAWRSHRSGTGRAALLSGSLFGLAVASKVVAAVFLPPLAVLLVTSGLATRARLRTCTMFLAGLVTVVVATWAPFGGLDAVRRMLAFQEAHNREGHGVVLLGRAFDSAPRWATPVFAWEGLGTAGCVALGLGTLVAVLLVRPRNLVVMLMTAWACVLLFLVIITRVALPHYYLDWVWIPTMLTGLGAVRLATLVRARRPAAAVIVATALVIAVTLSGLANARLVLSPPPDTLAQAQLVIDRRSPAGVTLVQGISPAIDVTGSIRRPVQVAETPGITAVVLGSDPENPLDPVLVRLAADPPRSAHVVRLGDLTVYTFRRPITTASGAVRLAPR